MNGSKLKLIAMIIMFIDHIGAILLPEYQIFRLIGRLSFPIFAYFVAEDSAGIFPSIVNALKFSTL